MELRAIQSQDWSALAAFWRSISQKGKGEWLSPWVDFIEQIAASKYTYGLYGYTSMHALGIAQTPEIRDGQDRFLVRYDPKRDIIRMVFTDSVTWWDDKPPKMRGEETWYRECKPDEAFLCFEKFLRQVGWFPETL